MTSPQPAGLARPIEVAPEGPAPEGLVPESAACESVAPEIRPPRRVRLVYGAALGLALFLIHQAGAISAILNPPPGYEAAWGVRNLDLPQYLTWIAAARSSILLPDYHAPWLTEPALFQPLFIAASWIPLPPLAAYYTFNAVLYMIGGLALMYAARLFCPGLEWLALLASACAVPLGMLVSAFAKIFPAPVLKVWGLIGMVDYSYNSADGLFRGGQAASLTLSAGTALTLLFMGLLARYVKSAGVGLRPLVVSLVIVSFASAFLHPFEIFVMIAASALPLKQCGRLRVWIAIAGAGLLGMAPHLAASVRSGWVRDLAGSMPDVMYPFWIPENFGIAFLLLSYFLLIRFRMEDARDRILQSWFLATIVLALIPKFTLSSHLFNGFAYCVGFLLVRRLAGDRKLMPAIARHRRGVTWTVAVSAAFTALSLLGFYRQIWQDGRRAQPEWMLSAVRPVSERPLLEWLRIHAKPHTLVVSPPELAPWIATVPLTSFASHDFFGVTYADQLKLAKAFFHGDDVEHELLENYGVGVVIAPSSSPVIARLPASAYQASVGTWRIYEFPDARMKPYPGFSRLKPEMAPPPRVRLLEWLRFLY